MELKTLWLGLVISMGAFAVKTGLGWSYVWAAGRTRRRLLSSVLIIMGYAALFGLVFLVVSRINLLVHYETLLPLWRNGVALHWLTAAMLAIWGLILLRRKSDSCCGAASSRGWLALVIPCPVCLSVVLMSAATLNLYFPEDALTATAGLFLAFMTMAVVAAFLARRDAGGEGDLEASLGLAMMLMAMYFMLSALLLPQFSEVSRIYRLTAYAADGQAVDRPAQAATLGVVLILLAFGFFQAKSNFRRTI